MEGGYKIVITGQGEAKARLAKFGPSPGVSRVAGEAAVSVIRQNFLKLDGERANALGGRRSHFYRIAAQNTNYITTNDGVKIAVTKPIGLRQRLKGGVIRAVNGKYLTIPARAESYGTSARQFSRRLKFIKFKSGAAALVVDEKQDQKGNRTEKRNKRLKTAGLVMYWLVPSVYQKPDPTVLPSKKLIAKTVTKAVTEYLMNHRV